MDNVRWAYVKTRRLMGHSDIDAPTCKQVYRGNDGGKETIG